MKTKSADLRSAFEHLREDGTIVSPQNASRMPAAVAVEALDVPIPKGRWLACLKEIENWWYDW